MTVTAKVRGEDVGMPLSEAVSGYQRPKEYTKSKMELAEQRREAETLREQYAGSLEMVMTTLGQALSPEVRQQVIQQHQRVQAQKQQETQQALAEIIPQERQKLEEHFGWQGDEASEARTRLREYANDLGFTDETLQGIVNHRAFVLLEKARRYDELQDRQSAVRDEVKGKRRKSRTLRPGTASRTSHVSMSDKAARKAGERLARTGRAHDAARVIETILD